MSTLRRVVLLSAPSGLTATVISASRIDLAWAAVTAAVGYRVYRGGVLVDSPAGTSSSSTGLSASTLYSFQVSTADGDGLEGPKGSAVTATTLAAPDTIAPSVPTIAVSTVSSSSQSVSLSVASTDTGGSGLASYELQRATNAAFTSNLVTQTVATTGFPVSVTGLSAATTYYYRALARDGAANASSYSATVNATTSASSSNPLDLPLYDPANIQYLGRFNVPLDADPFGGEGFGYSPLQGGGGIAYNPAGNGGLGSLFLVGYGPNTNSSANQVMAEISIPAPKTSSPNRAVLLQNFVRACGTLQPNMKVGDNGNVVSGLQVHNGRLYLFVSSVYLNTIQGPQPTCLVSRSLTLSDSASIQGPASVAAPTNQRIVAGQPGVIPDVWRSTFGNYTHFCGGGGNISIAGNMSNGPTFVFWNPSDMNGTAAVPGRAAVYWEDPATSPAPLGPFNGPFSSEWTGFSIHRGTVLLPDSRTVFAYGRHGQSQYVIGTGPTSNQVIDRFWLFDARDLKSAFDGTINGAGGDQCRPYAHHDMDICTSDNGSGPHLEDVAQRGLTFDPVNRLAYIVARRDGGNAYPAIHVLRFN